MPSWCDKLASTPGVGFLLNTHFVPFDTLLNAFSSVLDRASETEAKDTTVDQPATFFATGFTTHDGFKYAMDQSKVSVTFNHRLKFQNVSGGPPIMEMLSKPLPYTTLLPAVAKRLVEATLLMPEAKKRVVERVGVISTTPIAMEDVPPGIKRLIEYVGRPWKGLIDSCNLVINAQLASTSEVTERCIHTVTIPEEKEQLLTLQFDWQRKFKTPWTISQSNLERILDEAQKRSLQYFEELAEGSRFDEVLIRATATT